MKTFISSLSRANCQVDSRGKRPRSAALVVCMVHAFATLLHAQSQAEPLAPLAFEVVSVKPSAPGSQGGIIRSLPGNQTYIATNVPLRLLMTVAYSVTDRQIAGGPDWINTSRFDITAKAEHPGSVDELHRMLQNLLEDRFQLKVTHEIRQLPVWALIVDKNGSKMPEHDLQDLNHPPMSLNDRGGLSGTNVSMNYFAFILSRLLDRNVINKTNLSAYYDVTLEFSLDRFDGANPAPNQEGPAIFTALREQLGLKLESDKGPVEFLVIERAEKPSGN